MGPAGVPKAPPLIHVGFCCLIFNARYAAGNIRLNLMRGLAPLVPGFGTAPHRPAAPAPQTIETGCAFSGRNEPR